MVTNAPGAIARSLATVAIALGGFALIATPARAAGCGNEAVRVQQQSTRLPDCRAYELVSPVDKNGGEVARPGELAGGGAIQAAAGGGSITYSSSSSFGEGAAGAAAGSQYVSTRLPASWATSNITVPLFAGSYDTSAEGVPYRLFSPDLAKGLLLNGHRCRGEGTDCAVPNPPLAGTDAPAGYQNYYLREGGSYTALLGAGDVAGLALDPSQFELRLAGATPDLRHVVLSTCAALSADAAEVPLGDGCDPAAPNLYELSPGGSPALVNTAPGAELAAQGAAISLDGDRVFWKNTNDGNLYLREGTSTIQVDSSAGGGGTFQTASADGSVAYFTRAGHLYRYASGSSSDLTPAGGVLGVLGASADGSRVYYLSPAGLFLWNGGVSSRIAADADPSTFPPTSGAARVSEDGSRLLFVATAPITGYDNRDVHTGARDSEVYLYNAGSLTCVSCKPGGGRPAGPSTIPGAVANGSAPGSTAVYKPRSLSTIPGGRVFFDSDDALVSADTNADSDVYQWEAPGVGDCALPGGCVALISSGRGEGGASFLDASADGSDAFFLTDDSLVEADPGALDVYDARTGGGLSVPSPPIACVADACQPLPSPPAGIDLTTSLQGLGNPPVHYFQRCRKHRVKRHGRCVKKPRQRSRHGHRRGSRRR